MVNMLSGKQKCSLKLSELSSSSSSFYFANVKHRQQQVTDAIVAGQQGSELH